jgi:hypothetical protein
MVSNTQKRSVLKLPVFKEQTADFNCTSSKAVGDFWTHKRHFDTREAKENLKLNHSLPHMLINGLQD